MCAMRGSTTFALRHTQISLSGILRHFRPPSRHLFLHTHDTNMEFLQLSETTRAREIDAELKKKKWRNEWLDETDKKDRPFRMWLRKCVEPGAAWCNLCSKNFAWNPPGPGHIHLLDIFCFSLKPKFFTPTPVCFSGFSVLVIEGFSGLSVSVILGFSDFPFLTGCGQQLCGKSSKRPLETFGV